ncbi:HAMP domain-containing sensor histidine kinase [Asticcacaulis sp. BYS171W]|uniref:histidine kinase n=1 Tax=Asticcacaulis aquaticus TaxID=2984212 RepID=A0ABT5HX19_9CAUL|nr:HAMP domain-containing sensor histidine kinase [Asticcacaulis aquaticus]MDC7684629.1 HAMP domain-containing sensor histidine kinase [Asticcacaulis aquaticus]
MAFLSFFTRSLTRPLTLRLVAASVLVCAAAFAFVYAGLRQQGEAALRQTVDTDLAGLVDIYGVHRIDGLQAALTARLDMAPTRSEQPYYLLRDPGGKVLTGNITTPPRLDPAKSQAGKVVLADGVEGQARATTLRGGYSLIAGRSDALLQATLAQVRNLFLIALALMVAASIFISGYASRTLRTRVDTLNAVFDALETGQLDARAPVRPDGDELDQLGQHVNAVTARIHRLMKAQRDVSDHTAHETRTPLMSVERDIRLAQSASTDPVVLKPLDSALERIRSLLRLLDALLDIASAEAQSGGLKALEEIDISEVARSIAELYELSAEEAGLELVCDIEDGVTMRADAMQMSRLMVNLLDNALKYGKDGQQIRLSVRAGPVIVVEDDGAGVSDAEKPRIFERYRRIATPDGEPAQKGHGLGLALVKAIAERHDLGIRIEDTHAESDAEPGRRGARFVVRKEVA